MLSNTIPITSLAPRYHRFHVTAMINTIMRLHQNTDEGFAELYLCDLLNVSSSDDLIDEAVVCQEVQPAVTSSQLHELAERILPYNTDISAAIFSARNILNTVPQRIDDLIDYTTPERLQEFISMVSEQSFNVIKSGSKRSIKTLPNLIEALKDEPDINITMICNEQMELCRLTPLQDVPGISMRQKYLFSAANYYLNHLIGFRCNSMWLACYINSAVFGCTSGWLHRDGGLCGNLHFGFKDDVSIPQLVISSQEYIRIVFDSVISPSDDIEEMTRNSDLAEQYIRVLITALEISIKHNYATGSVDGTQFSTIMDLLRDYESLLTEEHRLEIITLSNIVMMDQTLEGEHFELLKEVIDNYLNRQNGPPRHLLNFFDAWNFLAFDINHFDHRGLGPLFLRVRFDEDNFIEFAEIARKIVLSEELANTDISAFKGFFENYLFMMINENSDTQYLFDEILDAALSVLGYVNIHHVIRTMAELGHYGSMITMVETLEPDRADYWLPRIVCLEEIYDV